MKLRIAFMFLLAFATPHVMAASSVVAVYCFDDNEGASVYANGAFMGECGSSGLIGEVPAGEVQIKAVKPRGDEFERVYEKALRLGSGGLVKVVVELGDPQLTAAARKEREQEIIRKQRAEAGEALAKARAGDIQAMQAMAEFYRQGKGVEESSEKSRYWMSRAEKARKRADAEDVRKKAESGDLEAMRRLATLYTEGGILEKNPAKAKAWSEKADSVAAEKTLVKAKAGDITAMEKMASYYAEGTGVAADPAKSREWNGKAQAARRSKEIEREKEREKIVAQKKLDGIDFMFFTNGADQIIKDMKKSVGDDDPGVLLGFTTSTPVATALDVLSTPVNSARVVALKRKIASRSAAFAEPESMIAKNSER